jgi:hypothetical protein
MHRNNFSYVGRFEVSADKLVDFLVELQLSPAILAQYPMSAGSYVCILYQIEPSARELHSDRNARLEVYRSDQFIGIIHTYAEELLDLLVGEPTASDVLVKVKLTMASI